MSYRPMKVHYLTGLNRTRRTRCGVDGTTTTEHSRVTCRICMFGILADVAPWARPFLDSLRGKRTGGAELEPIVIPAGLAEQVDTPVERASSALGRPFRQERGSQKAIRE